MAVLVQDNFDRANSTTVVGSPQVGPAPVAQIGTWGINTNQLYLATPVSSRGLLSYDVGTKYVDISLTWKSILTSVSTYLVFGGTGPADFWGAGAVLTGGSTAQWGFGRMTSTGFVVIENFSLSVAGTPAPWTMRVIHANGFVSIYKNGTQVGRWIDVSQYPITGNLAGVASTLTNNFYDDLLIQDPVATPSAYQSSGHIYKGRNLMSQDLAAIP